MYLFNIVKRRDKTGKLGGILCDRNSTCGRRCRGKIRNNRCVKWRSAIY